MEASNRELWKDFHRKRQSRARRLEARNRLVEQYTPLVQRLAARVSAKLPDWSLISADDLESAGVLGLVDAIERFEPARGWKFETFAGQRVHGAMMDELRRLDWVSRLGRRRQAAYRAAERDAMLELGRQPSDDELSERVGREVVQDARGACQWSLDAECPGEGRTASYGDAVADERTDDPLAGLGRDDVLYVVLRSLRTAERVVIMGHYKYGMSLKQVSKLLLLTPARVQQMHGEILDHLRERFEGRLECLV